MGVGLIRRSGGRGLRRRFHELLIAFQIALDSLFSISNGASQLDLGQIMRVETLDVTLMSAGHGLLRLNHLQIVGDAGRETIA